MSSIGFGLERIGLAALRMPILFSAIVAAISIAATVYVPSVRFNGNITAVLPEETQAYKDFFQQKAEFSDSAREITLLVQSNRLMSAAGLEELRFLHLELAIADDVARVISIFSAPDPDPVTGELGQFFPESFENDTQAVSLVGRLLDRYPQASRLIAPDHDTALLVATLNTSLMDGDEDSYDQYRTIRALVEDTLPEGYEVLYTGITPIGAAVVNALITDQLKLTTIGLLLGTGIAFYIFRSFLAALICALPPALTAIWSLGLLGFLQIPITYLTTVLPTLALILAFADGIVLYFRWQALNAEGGDLAENLENALRRVGPASALTSITTVLAFFSFSFASGSALKEFSALGMAVVSLAFLSVIMALPLAAHWAVRLGLARPGRARTPAFSGLGGPLFAIVSRYPRRISALAVAAVAVLAFVHTLVTPEFRVTDYLPKNSETRRAENMTNEVIGGRSPIFVTVPKAEPGSSLLPGNRERLEVIQDILGRSFDAPQILSADRLADTVETRQAVDRLAEQLESASEPARGAFVSRDGGKMLVTIYQPSDQPVAETRRQLGAVRAALERLPWGDDVVVTGFDVLMADEFTRLIEQLRTSLLIAIGLGIVIIGLATRSPMMAIAATTPNLLPIFAVELVIWLKGGTVNLSEVIALTISFGIAIDNAVHVINLFNREHLAGRRRIEAIEAAVREVGPALAASTAILCVSCLVTQLSVLPIVPVLGRLMVATLFVAYFSNLIILPANMLTLRWMEKKAFAAARSFERGAGE